MEGVTGSKYTHNCTIACSLTVALSLDSSPLDLTTVALSMLASRLPGLSCLDHGRREPRGAPRVPNF